MTQARQSSDAGVSLVEVLVVLVLVGVLTSAVALSLGAGGRDDAVAREADLLISRLNRIADELVLSGVETAFVWRDDRYGFQVRQGAGWVAHPVRVLAEPHQLPTRISLLVDDETRGSLTLGPDLILSSDGVARLVLAASADQRISLSFDGITARRATGVP